MAVGSGIQVPAELKSRLRDLASNNGVVRFTITDDAFTETNHSGTGATVDFRYKKAAELVSAVRNKGKPCFIMVLLKEKAWSLITYVPEDVPTREKMIYSSSKDALVEAWPQEIATMVQADDVSDIADIDVSKPTPRPFSQREIDQEEMTKMENESRVEHTRMAQALKKRVASGGYHVVTVPLTQSAKDELHSFKSQQISWIEFKISEGAKDIQAVDTKTSVPSGRLPISTTEPRFYLYRLESSNVFIYVCPEASQQKFRMVYSTSKPAMRDGIQAAGITIKKTIEYATASEVTSDAVKAEISYRAPRDIGGPDRPRRLNSLGGAFGVELKSTGSSASSSRCTSGANSPKVTSPHPIYSQMGNNSNVGGTRKSIVIPPPGAW